MLCEIHIIKQNKTKKLSYNNIQKKQNTSCFKELIKHP
jgi:hypothetical protein